jgi:hypothetical protein
MEVGSCGSFTCHDVCVGSQKVPCSGVVSCKLGMVGWVDRVGFVGQAGSGRGRQS